MSAQKMNQRELDAVADRYSQKVCERVRKEEEVEEEKSLQIHMLSVQCP